MTDEMILVPRAELLAWAKAWKNAYDPNDGTDCVTPFDTYLLKSPAPVGLEGLAADLETIWHSVSDDKETNAAYQRLKAALAQQPAAAPVGVEEVWLFKGSNGAWHTFHSEKHRLDTIADGGWDVRKFTTLAKQPFAAPVGVNVGDKDCLTTCARELLADEYRKRGIGTDLVNDAGTATSVAIAAIATALSQQPAACVGCEGKPSPENSPCGVCGEQPADVDGAMSPQVAREWLLGLMGDYDFTLPSDAFSAIATALTDHSKRERQ